MSSSSSSGGGRKSRISTNTGGISVPSPWSRSVDSMANPKVSDREVDAASIKVLLDKRDEARKTKKYSIADSCAAELQSLGICYHDDSKQWYTKRVSEGEAADQGGVQAQEESSNGRKTKRQERNRRQAEKNKKAKKTTKGDGEGEEGGHDE